MISIGLVLLVLAVVAVLLVACLQQATSRCSLDASSELRGSVRPANEMTDGDTRAVRLLLDHYATQRREHATRQMNES